MSIKEIAERAWAEIGADYNYPPDVAACIIERAIREAASEECERLRAGCGGPERCFGWNEPDESGARRWVTEHAANRAWLAAWDAEWRAQRQFGLWVNDVESLNGAEAEVLRLRALLAEIEGAL